MRHNRKAVMAERYKLYLRKHIFNGKYFMRNMQLFVCIVLMAGVMTCAVALNGADKDKVVPANAKVSAKDALFGTEQEEKSVTLKKEKKEAENVVYASPEADSKVSSEEKSASQNVVEQIVAEKSKSVKGTNENGPESTEEKSEQQPKSEFDEKCIANVEETLNIRKEASADSDFVGSMNPGAIATVEGTEGDWTKIKSGDVEGYVLTDYILTGEKAEQFASDYVTLRGTVLEDGVNVRAEKSTDADIVTVLDKDATLTVVKSKESEKEDLEKTESESEAIKAVPEQEAVKNAKTADEISWLSVELEDGKTGYVSADLVDVEKLYEIAVSAEELERQAALEEEAKRAAEEEAARQAAQEAAQSGGSTGSDEDYQGATTKPVTATESGECLGTFTITAYCGCKKCSGGHNKTATGTTPTEGRTIAADTSVLPYGTQVVIGGIVYTVEDCGSGVNGNHIDIFFATHKRAMAFGRKSMKVYKY